MWAAQAVCFSQESDLQAVQAEFEPEFDCPAKGNFPDPEFCMRYFRCDESQEVRFK